jgi:hypothetical protein
MVRRVRTRLPARRPPRRALAPAALALPALALLAALAALSGCGSGLRLRASEDARADVDRSPPSGCAATVLDVLGRVAARVYHEGISSERTASARYMVAGSAPLRAAVEAGDAQAARAAALSLIATGHLSDLRVVRAGRVLIDVGEPALAPLRGTLDGAAGQPIGTFTASVWTDSGLIDEVDGIAEGKTVLRGGSSPRAQRTIAGASLMPSGTLPTQGTLTHDGTAYEFASFAAASYPSGAQTRGYVLRTNASTSALCGASEQETTFNTLAHIARQIYRGEQGRRTLAQVRRVQRDPALLRAVADHDPLATRTAVEALLHEHLVRLRVSAGGRLLADVGGPFVLAPVRAPLRLGGRTIGSFVLSIQDDEGYKRLAERLAGLEVLMYMGSRLVKSTLGPGPAPIPTSGPVSVAGKSYRAYTFAAESFPSGPLRITVLIPTP